MRCSFVDLQAAFYSIMRSSLFDHEMHDDLICTAKKHLGITPEDWGEVRRIAAGDHVVAGSHPHKEAVLRDMFSGTH